MISSSEIYNDLSRKYRYAERSIAYNYEAGMELKANLISYHDKDKLFRATNQINKFGVVINQKSIRNEIFISKQTKQRYLDYVYLLGIKNALIKMMQSGVFKATEIDKVFLYLDNHCTATKQTYELRETLLQDYKYGSFNSDYTSFSQPLFPNITEINVQFCNSVKQPLTRSSDIIANVIYSHVIKGRDPHIRENLFITTLP